uniref:Pept_C1 domain-containing protein n=1 Tax=Panagrellus redivivus TaxID=6233 RepID=A0A7E4VSI0_PANRE
MVGKTALIVVLCVLGTSLAAEVGAGIVEQFKAHLAEHNIQIPEREFAWRTRIFADNLRRIDELNAAHPNTQFGTNKFSHLSFNEFIAKYTSGYTPSLANYTGPVHVWDVDANKPSAKDDVQVDWRARGKVTGVKDQGQLGSCTAFGVNGAIEAINAIKRNHLVSLSEQQVVDCVNDYNFQNEFGYAHSTGLVEENAYKYHASKGDCRIPGGNRVKTDGALVLSKNTEDGIENVLRTYGPMSVAIHVNDAFMYYKGGILTDGNCNSNWHAVTVVGLGRDNNEDYWIIKNSWSANWGEHGYIRLRRKQNTCDIEHEPVSAYIK